MNPKESDWKSFSAHVPVWRERYLSKKNREACAIFEDPSSSPTHAFWGAFEFLKAESKILRDCFDHHARSRMHLFLALMYRYGIVVDDDLGIFSNELQDHIRSIVRG